MTKRKLPPPVGPDDSYSRLIESAGCEFTDSVAFMVADKTVAARTKNPKYGPPEEMARRVSLAWDAILNGQRVQPHHVPLMLAVYHGLRFSNDPQDGKSLHDMAGQIRIMEIQMMEARK